MFDLNADELSAGGTRGTQLRWHGVCQSQIPLQSIDKVTASGEKDAASDICFARGRHNGTPYGGPREFPWVNSCLASG